MFGENLNLIEGESQFLVKAIAADEAHVEIKQEWQRGEHSDLADYRQGCSQKRISGSLHITPFQPTVKANIRVWSNR